MNTYYRLLPNILVAMIVYVTPAAAGCSNDPYLGSICFTAGKWCPAQNYLPADGSLLEVAQNPALYAVLGNVYGGSYPKTFALPNLNGRSPIATGRPSPNNPSISPVFLGQTSGATTITLNSQQLPMHTHPIANGAGSTPISVSDQPASATTASPNDYIASSPVDSTGNPIKMFTSSVGQPVPLNSAALPPDTGLNSSVQQPITVQSPVIGLTACIAVSGVYPTEQ